LVDTVGNDLMSKVKSISRTVERIQKKYGISDEDAEIMEHMLWSCVESRDRRIRHIDARLITLREQLQNSVDRQRVVSGLRSTIATYGPIDNSLIGSAVKRIIGL
jgi:hypothetical protein